MANEMQEGGPEPAGPETGKETDVFPNFLELTDKGADRFVEAVQESRGVLRILVHPFFSLGFEDGGEYRRYAEGLARLLRAESEKKLPLLVMEEGGDGYGESQNRFAGKISKSDRNRVWYLPTCVSDPLPVLEYFGGASSNLNTDEEELEVWRVLGEKLVGYGVKTVIVGGEYLTMSEQKASWDAGDLGKQHRGKNSWLVENSVVSCVGATCTYLAKYVQVEVSNIAYPDNRADILRAAAGKGLKV